MATTPSPRSSTSPPPQSSLRRVVTASMAGTVVEWYEFFLYATAATLVFNKIMFPPSDDPLTPIIAAFVTYAVGFVARPLGGIVFGHFGDKYGRKKLLQVAIVLVGVATFLMGCLPTYAQVGFLAPALLVTLRFAQGFAVGGEWGGAVLLVAEHSPDKSRGFWASFPQAAVPIGNLLATIVLLVLSRTLTEEQFLAWGWRIGFWLSVVIVAIGYYIRTRVTDAPIFLEVQKQVEQEEHVRYGVLEVLRRYPRGVFTAMGLRFAENIMYYLVVTFSITYLVVNEVNTAEILGYMVIAHIVHMLVIPPIGALADRIGRKPVFIYGAVASAVLTPVFLLSLESGSVPLMFLAAIGFFSFGYAAANSVWPAFYAEMFSTKVRFSGLAIGTQLGFLMAGFAPAIVAAMGGTKPGGWVQISIFTAVICLISAVSALTAKESFKIPTKELGQK